MEEEQNNNNKKYDFSGREILLVEDDETLSELIKTQFKLYGCELSHLSSGQGAVNKIKEIKPEIILLDILLPNQNGFDILEEIRNDPEVKDIPVIIISNLDSEQDLDQAKKLGVRDYLIKSTIVTEEIAEKVKEILEG